MTNPVRFTKMHGAGNDYIYVNTMAYPLETRKSKLSGGALSIQASGRMD